MKMPKICLEIDQNLADFVPEKALRAFKIFPNSIFQFCHFKIKYPQKELFARYTNSIFP